MKSKNNFEIACDVDIICHAIKANVLVIRFLISVMQN